LIEYATFNDAFSYMNDYESAFPYHTPTSLKRQG
jgi:hypothetical protein